MLWRTTLRKKLVSVTTDRAPAMTGRHSGFVAHCKQHQDFHKFCIIHQCVGRWWDLPHVLIPVVKMINSIRAKAKQHRGFKLILEESSAECGDRLLHTEIRRPSRGKILHSFLAWWNQGFHGIKWGGYHPVVWCCDAAWSCVPDRCDWETESLEPAVKR